MRAAPEHRWPPTAPACTTPCATSASSWSPSTRRATPDRATLDGLLAGAELALVADGWGADLPEASPAAIAARHPHLVVVSVTPYGLEGPAAGRAATELVAQSLAGVVYRSGVPELPPVSAPGSYCEDVGAVTAAMAGVIALHQAAADGVGQVVDVASILALAQCTEMSLPIWSLLHFDQVRAGGGLYPLFPCSDGLARIVLPMSPLEWRSLIVWMGSPPEWTGPEWEQAMLGEGERGQIMARLPEMFAGRTREQVTAEADAAGVRVTPVLTPAEVLSGEHVVARGTFTDVALAGGTGKVFAGLYGVDGQRVPFRGLAAEGAAPTWPARPAPSAPATVARCPAPRRPARPRVRQRRRRARGRAGARRVGRRGHQGREPSPPRLPADGHGRRDEPGVLDGRPGQARLRRRPLDRGRPRPGPCPAPLGRHRRGEQRHRGHRPPRLRMGRPARRQPPPRHGRHPALRRPRPLGDPQGLRPERPGRRRAHLAVGPRPRCPSWRHDHPPRPPRRADGRPGRARRG